MVKLLKREVYEIYKKLWYFDLLKNTKYNKTFLEITNSGFIEYFVDIETLEITRAVGNYKPMPKYLYKRVLKFLDKEGKQ